MGTVIVVTSLGSRFGVARRLSVKKELIAFGHPSGMRGTLDRRVRRRPACEGFLARDVRRTGRHVGFPVRYGSS